jgi:FixJ family two-component response regulator
MSSSLLIAIIDDDDSAREAAAGLVRALGFNVAGYPDAATFLATADMSQIACLITDMRMAGMSGLALHNHLRASSIFLPTILMTAYPDDATRDRAKRAGLADYLSKPLAPAALLAAIRRALEQSRPPTPAGRRTIQGEGA